MCQNRGTHPKLWSSFWPFLPLRQAQLGTLNKPHTFLLDLASVGAKKQPPSGRMPFQGLLMVEKANC